MKLDVRIVAIAAVGIIGCLPESSSRPADLQQPTGGQTELTRVDLGKRWIPEPNPCQGEEHWVGKFCDMLPGQDRRIVHVCWKYPTLAEGQAYFDAVYWPRTWEMAITHGGLDVSRFNLDLFRPGVLNAERIPTHSGRQLDRWTECPEFHKCFPLIDEQADPHTGCVDLRTLRDPVMTTKKYMLQREYLSLPQRLKQMKDEAEAADPDPPSPIGSPVRGRPLVATWTLDREIDAGSLTALLVDDKGQPVEVLKPIVVELMSPGQSGDKAKAEQLCVGSPSRPGGCASQAVHDYHKDDVLKVHFVVPLLRWAGDAIYHLAIMGAIAHIGGHVGSHL